MRVEPVRVDQVPKWIWLVMLALGLFSFLFNNKYLTRIWRTVRFPGSSGWPLVPATVEQGIVHTYPVWGLKLPGSKPIVSGGNHLLLLSGWRILFRMV